MASRHAILPLTLAALGVLAAVVAVASPGDVTRVSLLDASGTAGGDQDAQGAAVSADGRFVAFTSTAKLTAVDNGGKRELYVRDRVTGRTLLASASAAGAPADQDVIDDQMNVPYAISGNGRYVVFVTPAGNLVPGDANTTDVFRKDLSTGAIVLVDVNAAGQQANGSVAPGDPDISYDGNRVAYTSGQATNLWPGDANGVSDIVLRDLSTNAGLLVAQNSAGVPSDNFTERPAISADGRFVSFDAAMSTNLVPGELQNEIVVRDTLNGTTDRATVTTAGAPIGNANFSDISGDGRYVVFQTAGVLDPANDPNTGFDVYRRDMVAKTTLLVSAKDGATQSGAATGGLQPAISADGSRVLFASDATDLIGAGDSNAVTDAYVRDVGTLRTTRISTGPGAVQLANASVRDGVSANGALATFGYTDTLGQGVVAGDTNQKADVFARELVPTDVTPPPISLAGPADGASGPEQQVTVAGTVGADPSGVVGATLNGAPLQLNQQGGFSATLNLPVGPTALTVAATDGSGNTSAVTRTVTRTLPAGATPGSPGSPVLLRPVRPTSLRYTLKKKRLVVRFRLPAPARVRVQLLRVTTVPKSKPVRYRYKGVGKAVNRSFAAGDRSVTLVIPVLKPARYQVRVSAVSAGGLAQAVRAFTVKPPKKAAKKAVARNA